MHIYPLKKLIIIYGLHIDQIQNHTTEEGLMKILTEQYFVLNTEMNNLNDLVYKSVDYSDHTKRTHVVINFGGEISEIKYYTTKQ